MIEVIEIKKEEEKILSNLLQKYLYEMTLYYDDPMNAEGNFEYPYLKYYFLEPERQAYFICKDGERVGFAMVNTHSFTGEAIDSCIAEFTIFPTFRKHGFAMESIGALMRKRPGTWQLKYSTVNAVGMTFWKKVCEKYHGTETPLEGTEIAVTFNSI